MTSERDQDSNNFFKQTVHYNPTVEQHCLDANQHHGIAYYEEFKKIYETSYRLFIQVRKLRRVHCALSEKILKIQKRTQDFQEGVERQEKQKRKRSRRTAEEIQRKYQCQVQYCGKCYGSDGSLQQHIKLKHPEIYVAKNSQDF